MLPFRVNEYVLRELIDWDNIPNDPTYRLTFPRQEMLLPDKHSALRDCMFVHRNHAMAQEIVKRIRRRMNPNPAAQMPHNVPTLDGCPLRSP